MERLNRQNSANTVVRHPKYYKMDHPNRGIAYIFNHRQFEENYETRLGTDEDCRKIINCLNKLGFSHICFNDLKLAEIIYRIHEVVNMNHTNNDCLMVFVLTHGNVDGKLQAMDQAYDPEEVLWNQFTAEKCPTLAGKPKLFFVHAPQGSNVDPGIQLVHKPRKTETDGIEDDKIPIQADFLIMYSTARGYYAFHGEGGSHFISVLTEELEKGINGTDFLTILTLVNQRVAVEFTSENVDIEKHNKKQAPYFHSYLTRTLKFTRQLQENMEITGNMPNNTLFDSIPGDVLDGGCIGKASNDVSDGENGTAQLKDYREKPSENFAWASVNKDDLYYKMDHGNKGLAYIFNHEKFDKNTTCCKRPGSEVDRKKVEECFRSLGFEVQPFQDLKLDEIRNQIQQAVDMDHTNRDCFALVVLSHGNHNLLYASDASYDPNEELWGQFTADKCPSLAGKPKLFFVQACQGDKLDPGVRMRKNRMPRTETDGGRLPYTIPVHSDFLIAYASAKGYFAFRNTHNGSVFITIFCQELKKLAYEDHLLNILTNVNQRVAIEFISNTSKDLTYDRKKQMPYFHSSLTRLLHFVMTTKL